MERKSLREEFIDWCMTFVIVAILSVACNVVGYGGVLLESLPGMLIFAAISLAGLTIKHFVPGDLPAVAYIALIGMVLAMPFSPVSGFIIYWANKVNLMAVVTPILAYAGVIVGRDWREFVEGCVCFPAGYFRNLFRLRRDGRGAGKRVWNVNVREDRRNVYGEFSVCRD